MHPRDALPPLRKPELYQRILLTQGIRVRNCDHGKYTREHSKDDGKAHQLFSSFKSHTTECIRNHQYKAGRDNAGKQCHDKGIFKPCREVCSSIRLKEQLVEICQRPVCRKEMLITYALCCGQRCHNQPDDRDEPDECEQCKYHMSDYDIPCFLFHYWYTSSLSPLIILV